MTEHASTTTPAIHEVFAYLCVADSVAAIDFYQRAFGATELFRLVEPSGRVGHAELKLGPMVLMLSDAFPEYDIHAPQAGALPPVRIHLHVDNADAMVAQAIAAGATALGEVSDAFYGERGGRVVDPFGHVWLIGHSIEEVTPEEMQRRYTAMFQELKRRMHLLVIGGTVFLGRHIVEAALAAGHRVTLFNRGRQAALFPEAEHLRGDRDADLSALQGRRFDAVIDTCGYRPEQLAAMAAALGDGAPFYLFVSSISAHAGFPPHTPYDESASLAEGRKGYGPLKARSEETIAAALPGRVAIVRPGLIVGPHDPTGRYTYWPMRLLRGGEVLAPGRPERPVQWIDARDLAAWCLHLAATRTTGVFNAVGPMHTMAALLGACRAVAGSDARLHWIADDILLAAGFAPWTELPLWLPETDATHGGMLLGDARRAVSAGLTSRRIEATVSDVLAWACAEVRPASVATLTADKEAAWLAAHRPS